MDCLAAKTKEDIKAADSKVLAKIEDLKVADGTQAVKLCNDLHKTQQRRNDTKREVAETTSIPPRARFLAHHLLITLLRATLVIDHSCHALCQGVGRSLNPPCLHLLRLLFLPRRPTQYAVEGLCRGKD